MNLPMIFFFLVNISDKFLNIKLSNIYVLASSCIGTCIVGITYFATLKKNVCNSKNIIPTMQGLCFQL